MSHVLLQQLDPRLAVLLQQLDPCLLFLFKRSIHVLLFFVQLLLDPAVGREFTRLRGDLEIAQMALKTAQEDLSAVAFTQVRAVSWCVAGEGEAVQIDTGAT